MFDVVSLKANQLIHDPALRHVSIARSDISFIDGQQGLLKYRGVSIEEVARSYSFAQTLQLLVFGNAHHSPGGGEDTDRALARHLRIHEETLPLLKSLPATTHPMSQLACFMTMLPAVSATLLSSRPSFEDHLAFLIGQLGAAILYIKKRDKSRSSPVDLLMEPAPEGASFESAFIGKLRPYADETTKLLLENILRTVLVLHAEHEQNCSTLAVRVAASARSPIENAIASGLHAFMGPRHGGASEDVARMYRMITDRSITPEAYVDELRSAAQPIPGFGHRVYRAWDPRARIMLDYLESLPNDAKASVPELDYAKRFMAKIENDRYFQARQIYPNPDLINNILFRMLDFPGRMNSSLLSLSRIAGWVAHYREHVATNLPIMRPRQLPVASVS